MSYDCSTQVRAFLNTIRWAEGTDDEDGYQALYGHTKRSPKTFGSFADHPRIAFGTPWGWTSAAGAYQFMAAVPGKVKTDTWDRVKALLQLPDFSPESQDRAAVQLIRKRGALDDVESGRIQAAIEKCSWEWASLPPGRYGQPMRSMVACLAKFEALGGKLAGTPDVVPSAAESAPVQAQPQDVGPEPVPPTVPLTAEARPADESAVLAAFGLDESGGLSSPPAASPPIKKESRRMSAVALGAGLNLVGALLPELLRLLPMFSSGSKVAERNIAAVQALAPAAQEALGKSLLLAGRSAVPMAANDQEVVETLRESPELRASYVAKVVDSWDEVAPFLQFDAQERAAARNWFEKMTGSGPLWRQIGAAAGVVAVSAVVIGVFAYISLTLIGEPGATQEIKNRVFDNWQLFAAAAVFFWLGSSSGSKRKDGAAGPAR